MPGPPAATAAVRLAVRRCLADLPADAAVAAAVSGGADSLALAAALAFERPGALALVVDHGLQPGSAQVATHAAEQCAALGLTAEVLTPPGNPQHQGAVDFGSGGGPEAVARELRYRLLDDAVRRRGLAAVLLGHTLDDQAETVLLGLVRGAGARALAGMPPVRGAYRRPLLGTDRATVRTACAEADLQPHEDAHNVDAAFTRVRARRLLPELERELGPGVVPALARTAAQLREDADALDALAPDLPDDGPDCAALQALPAAVRARALKRWAEQRCGRALTAAHVDALRGLVERWHGQGALALPGGVRVERRDGRLQACPAAD